MACGAAIVAAANDGVMDYLTDGVDALTCKPTYWQDLAQKVIDLLEDDPKRIAVAKKGSESIREYTWPRAVESFEKFLMERS